MNKRRIVACVLAIFLSKATMTLFPTMAIGSWVLANIPGAATTIEHTPDASSASSTNLYADTIRQIEAENAHAASTPVENTFDLASARPLGSEENAPESPTEERVLTEGARRSIASTAAILSILLMVLYQWLLYALMQTGRIAIPIKLSRTARFLITVWLLWPAAYYCWTLISDGSWSDVVNYRPAVLFLPQLLITVIVIAYGWIRRGA